MSNIDLFVNLQSIIFPSICFFIGGLYLIIQKHYNLFAASLLIHFWIIFSLIFFQNYFVYEYILSFTDTITFFIFLYCVLDCFSKSLNFHVHYEILLLFSIFCILSIFSYFNLGFSFDFVLSFLGFFIFTLLRFFYFYVKNKVDAYLGKGVFSTFLQQWTYFWLFTFINSVLFFILLCFWQMNYSLLIKYLKLDFVYCALILFGVVSIPYFIYLCDNFVNYLFSKLFSIASGYSYRAQTLKVAVKWGFRIIFGLIFLFIWLSTLSINISTVSWNLSLIVAVAGVGFKGVIDDFINGICVLIEDSVNIGEFIYIDEISGRVEDVTLRVVKLRSFDGSFYIIPFRKVDVIKNRSKEFVYIVIDVMVDVSVATIDVFNWLKDGYQLFKKSEAMAPYTRYLLEEFEIIGVRSFSLTGVCFEGRFKIFPNNTRFIQGGYLNILIELAKERNIKFGFESAVVTKNIH